MSKTTNNTITVSEAMLNAIIFNHGFANKRLNAEQIEAPTLFVWHATLDTLLVDAYKVASDAHNGNNANVDSIYATLGGIFKAIGELPNGAVLRSDSDSAITMVNFSSCEKNKYSTEFNYKKSQIALEKSFVRQNTQDDGVTPKKGMEQSVQSHLANIEKYEEELEGLKSVAYSISKQTTRVSKSAFYKKVEDYIAEKALGLLAKTNEEIKAEEDARKAERNKKANARKAEKKAQNK